MLMKPDPVSVAENLVILFICVKLILIFFPLIVSLHRFFFFFFLSLLLQKNTEAKVRFGASNTHTHTQGRRSGRRRRANKLLCRPLLRRHLCSGGDSRKLANVQPCLNRLQQKSIEQAMTPMEEVIRV